MVALQRLAVEGNLVVVFARGVAVGPGDNHLQVRLHGAAGFPGNGVGVEGLGLSVVGGGVYRRLFRALSALTQTGGSGAVQNFVVVLGIYHRLSGAVGDGVRHGHSHGLGP